LISPSDRSMLFVRSPSMSWLDNSPCWARSGACFTRSTSTHAKLSYLPAKPSYRLALQHSDNEMQGEAP
jgi:hypothetical protein